MALDILNITTTINSVSFLADSVPAAYHSGWGYSLNGGKYVVFNYSSQYRVNHTITGLSENTTYSLKIRAYVTGVGTLVYSSTVNFTTKKNTTAPTVSASITAATATGFTINGTANYPCRTWQYQIDGGAWQSLSDTTSSTSVSKAITGLTPGQTYSVRVRATRTYNGVTGTSGAVSGATLGASILNSVNTVTADAATARVTFNWTVAAGTDFTHNLWISDGVTTIMTLYGLIAPSGSVTVDLTSGQRTALLNMMPDRKSFLGYFELQTIDGISQVGSTSIKTATIRTTEANSAPEMASFTHSEQNPKVAAVVGGSWYVNLLSDIKAVCDPATAKNGASIVKYGLTIGGKTVESSTPTINYGLPPGGGANREIIAWVEDSRGYRASLTDTKTIAHYARPQVTEWQARRKDSIGEQTALRAVGVVRVSSKAELEKAEYRIKPSDGEYGSWTELAPMEEVGGALAGYQAYEYYDLAWETLDAEKSHTVQIRYQDTFEEYGDPITFTVARGIPLMSFRDGKVGVNQYNPQAGLDVNGGLIVDGIPMSWDVEKTATLVNGWTGDLKYRKHNGTGIVAVYGFIISPSTTPPNRQIITTLDNGWRPSTFIAIPAYNMMVGRILLAFKLDSTGVLSCELETPSESQNINASSAYRFSIMYIAA